MILTTVLTPKTAPINVKGAKYLITLKFTFPLLAKLKELVKAAAVEDNLFVPRVK